MTNRIEIYPNRIEIYPMKYRMADEIASVLMGQQPDKAHLYALKQVIEGNNPDLWRSVLIELDKLQGEKNASIELHETQQHRT